jgi:hypothetical protein
MHGNALTYSQDILEISKWLGKYNSLREKYSLESIGRLLGFATRVSVEKE